MVHILDLDALFGQKVGQVFGHFLGQGRDEDPFVFRRAGVDLAQQVGHLALDRAHRDERVQQAGGPDDLLRDLRAVLPLILAGRSRHEHDLVQLRLHLFEFERAVVKRRGQAEAILHQRFFTGKIAAVHGADLGQGDMALVHEEQKILREIIQQGGRHTARRTARQHRRIVLDALAHADLGQHLDVVIRPLLDALGLDELALGSELFDLRVALGADLFQCLRLFFGADDIVAGREDGHMLDHVLLGPGDRVELNDAVDLIPKKLHPDGQVAHIGQVDVHRVAVNTELVADKIDVVALILQVHEPLAQHIALHLHAGAQADDHAAVVDGVAQRVDAGHRCHDDNIPPLRQRRRGRVAQAVDLIVDGAVFFNIGIRAGDIGFGLVVIVVGHEILHRIVRKKRPELGAELRRQRFIVGQHQRGAVALGDHVRHGEGLAAAGHTQQGLAAVAALHTLHKLLDGLRLVARRGIVRDQMEGFICHAALSFRLSWNHK